MIPFNRAPYTGDEDRHVMDAMRGRQIAGNGKYTRLCEDWIERQTGTRKAFLTPSCTAALECAALLLGLRPGDEVIMPSYTFTSTANAFALRGARIVFVDIRPDTMNIDENAVEAAITPRTKAICVMHYAGLCCAMDRILAIAEKHGLYVVEDAAQAMTSRHRDRAAGTLGHIGAFSFHETKNYTSGGEGGALLINRDDLIARAEILREKGTNRSQFFRGETDKYSWTDIGGSFLPGELQAAYLWGQLGKSADIGRDRMASWTFYRESLEGLRAAGRVELPHVPGECAHNAHIFYVKARDLAERTALIAFLRERGAHAVFHYVPLHDTPPGRAHGRFHGEDRHTTRESERLLRLPLWYGLPRDDAQKVVAALYEFHGI